MTEKQYNHHYYITHRKAIKRKRKQHYKDIRDRVILVATEWNKTNKERRREIQKRYRRSHKK